MKENLDFQRIQTAWTRYVAGPESVPEQIPGVRPEIVDSWRRSKGQADPFALEKTIPSDHLQALVQDNAQLIRIARTSFNTCGRPSIKSPSWTPTAVF